MSAYYSSQYHSVNEIPLEYSLLSLNVHYRKNYGSHNTLNSEPVFDLQ